MEKKGWRREKSKGGVGTRGGGLKTPVKESTQLSSPSLICFVNPNGKGHEF